MYSWTQAVGERPLEQNLESFYETISLVEILLRDCGGADLVMSELQKICKPQYLLSVLRDMQLGKLLMTTRTHGDIRLVEIRVIG